MNEVFKNLTYDKDTGVFLWVGGVRNGRVAGSLDEYGYIRISIKRKKYRAHRLAWLYCYGRFPEFEIDHINRIKTDNRICNLRDVSSSKNSENTKIRSDNKSGVKGVSWNKAENRWYVHIKSTYHGSYENLMDAKNKRMELELSLNVDGAP